MQCASETRQICPGLRLHRREKASYDNAAVAVQSQTPNRSVHVGIKIGYHAAGARQLAKAIARLPAQSCEKATDDDCPIGLNADGIDLIVSLWIKAVQGAVGVYATEVGTTLAGEIGKRSSNQNFAVDLHGNGSDPVIGSDGEGIIQGSVRV